jgi:hypothetical protein
MKRVILLAAGLAFIATVGTGLYVIANYERLFNDSTIPTRPVIYSESVSPDGKYRCVVKQYPPSQTSTYNYQFTIQDNATHADLKGGSFTRGTDSVPTGKLEFDWFADGLRVSDLNYHPREPFATAKIDNGAQHWTDLMRR